jgi:aminoglycoside 3-N-acetyltransferase
MVAFRDLLKALRHLEIDGSSPVIAHASLSAFGEINGGAGTVVGALLAAFKSVMAPTFTYKAMILPETGPPDNACAYGSGRNKNRMAEFFRPDMPADRLMGAVPETLRRHPLARRSSHPILSFAGVNLNEAISAQTLAEPLAPIHVLAEVGSWVLLLGVDHTVNTSIHYAERLVGRKQFTRWALTPQGVKECPGFPGCSEGFQAIATRLQSVKRQVEVGEAWIYAVSLADLVASVRQSLVEDPSALLCSNPDCERCSVVRRVTLAHPDVG